jgi:hypothetical protein
MRPAFLFIIIAVIVIFGGWLNDWNVGWFVTAIACIALGFLTHRNLK